MAGTQSGAGEENLTKDRKNEDAGGTLHGGDRDDQTAGGTTKTSAGSGGARTPRMEKIKIQDAPKALAARWRPQAMT